MLQMERFSIICTNANRTIGFLRQNLRFCPHDVKKAAKGPGVSPGVLQSGLVPSR